MALPEAIADNGDAMRASFAFVGGEGAALSRQRAQYVEEVCRDDVAVEAFGLIAARQAKAHRARGGDLLE